jgi:hypothetical protein
MRDAGTGGAIDVGDLALELDGSAGLDRRFGVRQQRPDVVVLVGRLRSARLVARRSGVDVLGEDEKVGEVDQPPLVTLGVGLLFEHLDAPDDLLEASDSKLSELSAHVLGN